MSLTDKLKQCYAQNDLRIALNNVLSQYDKNNSSFHFLMPDDSLQANTIDTDTEYGLNALQFFPLNHPLLNGEQKLYSRYSKTTLTTKKEESFTWILLLDVAKPLLQMFFLLM